MYIAVVVNYHHIIIVSVVHFVIIFSSTLLEDNLVTLFMILPLARQELILQDNCWYRNKEIGSTSLDKVFLPSEQLVMEGVIEHVYN